MEINHSPHAPESVRKEEVQFSPWWTAFCLGICLAGMTFLIWSVSETTDILVSGHSSRDLNRLADRLLGFESQLLNFSELEQTLFQIWAQEGSAQEEIRVWYEELNDSSTNPEDKLYLGILHGESQRLEDLRDQLEGWEDDGRTAKFFREMLRIVYIEKKSSSHDFQFYASVACRGSSS